MTERPATERPAPPKSSETDPPAANQPVGHSDDDPASSSTWPSPAEPASEDQEPGIVPGKPDGEVDTRP